MPRDPDATRQRLVDAAAAEIHRHGYRAASMERILATAEVTKGALYHHFGSKHGLAIAVFDEVVVPSIERRWLTPLGGSDPALEILIDQLRGLRREATAESRALGCRLGNLAVELGAFDEELGRRAARLADRWRDAITTALRGARDDGSLRPGVDIGGLAAFYVATCQGAIGLAKAEADGQAFERSLAALEGYLESLRPAPRPVVPKRRRIDAGSDFLFTS